MAFQDDLELTYTTEVIKQWSNAGNDTGATTVNAASVAHVKRLVESVFWNLAGVIYDEDDIAHLQPAMAIAGDYYKQYSSELGFSGDFSAAAEDAVRRVRLTQNSDVMTPKDKVANSVPFPQRNRSAFDFYTQAINGAPVRRSYPPNYYGGFGGGCW